MIGRITNDVQNLVSNRNELFNRFEELKFNLKSEIEKQTELEKLLSDRKDEIENLKSGLNSLVSIDDINSLVEDIKQSFEMFVLNTPRESVLPGDILERIERIEQKLAIIPTFEIIKTKEQPVVKASIPKLNISKKKK